MHLSILHMLFFNLIEDRFFKFIPKNFNVTFNVMRVPLISQLMIYYVLQLCHSYCCSAMGEQVLKDSQQYLTVVKRCCGNGTVKEQHLKIRYVCLCPFSVFFLLNLSILISHSVCLLDYELQFQNSPGM